MVLRREVFRKAKTGPCGALRNDMISYAGIIPNKVQFASEAEKIKRRYELSINEGGQDVYLLEYFEGNVDQTTRGYGKSYFKMEYENTGWSYYEDGVFVYHEKLHD